MSNVDLEIHLEDETMEALLDIYIRTHMTSGSYEVFLREKEHQFISDAAGKAVLNEAIVNAVEAGTMADMAKDDDEPTFTEYENLARDNDNG